jgi:hypothetical protein
LPVAASVLFLLWFAILLVALGSGAASAGAIGHRDLAHGNGGHRADSDDGPGGGEHASAGHAKVPRERHAPGKINLDDREVATVSQLSPTPSGHGAPSPVRSAVLTLGRERRTVLLSSARPRQVTPVAWRLARAPPSRPTVMPRAH